VNATAAAATAAEGVDEATVAGVEETVVEEWMGNEDEVEMEAEEGTAEGTAEGTEWVAEGANDMLTGEAGDGGGAAGADSADTSPAAA
jgi:hypothetical protein